MAILSTAAHLVPSRDRYARRRQAVAAAAALALHAGVIALLLWRPVETPPPPVIPVELVLAPASSPPPAAAPAPTTPATAASAPSPKAPAASVRESGGERPSAPGHPPDAATAPERPAPAPPPAKASAALTAAPLPVPRPEAQALPAPARAAAVTRPPARAAEESDVAGKGGGDRYLNALRDTIERHRAYPPEARAQGLSGTAQYDLLLDRSGRLMHVRLLRSSGAEILDKAGAAMIAQSAPFAPPPPELIGTVVDLVVTLHLEP